ncbi:hypothetical protein PAXRUDRAFT_168926 [Paxillus rubicundulus Ve08.2h10]|uniref:Uncharacterized protein n=1 Tax=Paxillus rubicundulus Ve08.2h10 TaxID=930991 RepID=A0A0D0CN73_9AGAM|nr:hypothetical protein PAXRUDRAFT_168926 [Paxillus rubicundulus Ve08.2h10]
MPALTSMQLYKCIVAWQYEMHLLIDEIVKLSGLCHATIYNILQLQEDFGTPKNLMALSTGWYCSLEEQDLSYIQALLCANPTLFLDEIQSHLTETHNVDVSISTLSCTL